jgi:S1-C subfamily serine protease
MSPAWRPLVFALACLGALLAAGCGRSEHVTIALATQAPLAQQQDASEARSTATPSPAARASASPTAAPAASPSPSPASSGCDEATVRRVVRPSIVQVANERPDGQTTTGTGFAIGGGRILTNEHVVHGAARLSVVLPDGQRLSTRPLRADEGRDLALLDMPGGALPSLAFGSAAALTSGARLYTLGFPIAAGPIREPLLTGGSLLATPQINGLTFLQTTIPAGVGNSGGPIVTACGEVVGVVSSGAPDSSGVMYGVALSAVQAFLGGAPPLTLDSIATTPRPVASPSPTPSPTSRPPTPTSTPR